VNAPEPELQTWLRQEPMLGVPVPAESSEKLEKLKTQSFHKIEKKTQDVAKKTKRKLDQSSAAGPSKTPKLAPVLRGKIVSWGDRAAKGAPFVKPGCAYITDKACTSEVRDLLRNRGFKVSWLVFSNNFPHFNCCGASGAQKRYPWGAGRELDFQGRSRGFARIFSADFLRGAQVI
jgi:hypothetical protein